MLNSPSAAACPAVTQKKADWAASSTGGIAVDWRIACLSWCAARTEGERDGRRRVRWRRGKAGREREGRARSARGGALQSLFGSRSARSSHKLPFVFLYFSFGEKALVAKRRHTLAKEGERREKGEERGSSVPPSSLLPSARARCVCDAVRTGPSSAAPSSRPSAFCACAQKGGRIPGRARREREERSNGVLCRKREREERERTHNNRHQTPVINSSPHHHHRHAREDPPTGPVRHINDRR